MPTKWAEGKIMPSDARRQLTSEFFRERDRGDVRYVNCRGRLGSIKDLCLFKVDFVSFAPQLEYAKAAADLDAALALEPTNRNAVKYRAIVADRMEGRGVHLVQHTTE